MADPEREDAYYHPSGIPITPQARRFGYEFPVYVSDVVWSTLCVSTGIPSKHGTNIDKRIFHLLQYCYDGMTKELARHDDFVYYSFKAWYWDRKRPGAKKQSKIKLGARLLLDPSTGGPWLYIFDPNVDTIDMLKAGAPDSEEIST